MTQVRRSCLLNIPGTKNCASGGHHNLVGFLSGHHNLLSVMVLSLITLGLNLCLWMVLLDLSFPKRLLGVYGVFQGFHRRHNDEMSVHDLNDEYYILCRTTSIQLTQTIGRYLVEVIGHRPAFSCMIFLCASNIVVQFEATLDSSFF